MHIFKYKIMSYIQQNVQSFNNLVDKAHQKITNTRYTSEDPKANISPLGGAQGVVIQHLWLQEEICFYCRY